MRKKLVKSLLLLTVCAVLMLPCIGAEAEEAIYGKATKEEIIYASLDSSGSIKEAYVINAFNVEKAGIIKDYGNYSSLKNLTTNEAIDVNGDEIAINANAGMYYYQGNTSQLEMPWNIRITYTLDGKPVTGHELAGATGYFYMNIKISPNTNALTKFPENFMLQTTVKLDTRLCTDIQASSGSLATYGNDKMIVFSSLPGGSAEYSVQAKVKDFEMESVQFAGIITKLTLNIDTSMIKEKLSFLTDKLSGISAQWSLLTDAAAAAKNNSGASNDSITARIALLEEKAQTASAEIKAVYLDEIEYLKSLKTDIESASTQAAKTKEAADGIDKSLSVYKNITSDMDAFIKTASDTLLSSFTGGAYVPSSYISDKNTDVTAVQFVFMTDKIAIEKEASLPVVAKEETVIDRLYALWDRLISWF